MCICTCVHTYVYIYIYVCIHRWLYTCIYIRRWLLPQYTPWLTWFHPPSLRLALQRVSFK